MPTHRPSATCSSLSSHSSPSSHLEVPGAPTRPVPLLPPAWAASLTHSLWPGAQSLRLPGPCLQPPTLRPWEKPCRPDSCREASLPPMSQEPHGLRPGPCGCLWPELGLPHLHVLPPPRSASYWQSSLGARVLSQFLHLQSGLAMRFMSQDCCKATTECPGRHAYPVLPSPTEPPQSTSPPPGRAASRRCAPCRELCGSWRVCPPACLRSVWGWYRAA